MKYKVYIISHSRADRVETYDTLRNAGYTGEIKVVVDEKDPQLPLYSERFGDELDVFNKDVMKWIVDTLTREKKDASPVYARLYVEFVAHGSAYIIMDDDIKNLRYRWLEDGKIRSLSITQNLDKLLDFYVEYMLSCDIDAVSFSNVMLYVGGTYGIDRRITGNREMYQIHMRNTNHSVFEWKSIANNDTITELLQARYGNFIWSLPFVVYDSPKMNTLPGGMKSVYDSIDDFRRAFLATVALPSVCKPVLSKGKWVIGRDKKSAYPLVISSRYKK